MDNFDRPRVSHGATGFPLTHINHRCPGHSVTQSPVALAAPSSCISGPRQLHNLLLLRKPRPAGPRRGRAQEPRSAAVPGDLSPSGPLGGQASSARRVPERRAARRLSPGRSVPAVVGPCRRRGFPRSPQDRER